eukprot:6186703-Pleurochrysis_carterae.AAC.4
MMCAAADRENGGTPRILFAADMNWDKRELHDQRRRRLCDCANGHRRQNSSCTLSFESKAQVGTQMSAFTLDTASD